MLMREWTHSNYSASAERLTSDQTCCEFERVELIHCSSEMHLLLLRLSRDIM